ncbi:exodeoxyribonuclease VII small subunit [Arthrobacter pigmenti]
MSTEATGTVDVAELSYEQAREELIAVVGKLETGGITLEDSLALWERGEALAQRCEQWLEGARKRLDAARTAGPDEDGEEEGGAPGRD